MIMPLLGLWHVNRMDLPHAACIRTHRSETELASDQPLFSNKHIAQIINGNQQGLIENTMLRENQRCTNLRAAISCLLSPRPKAAKATQNGDHNVLHVWCPWHAKSWALGWLGRVALAMSSATKHDDITELYNPLAGCDRICFRYDPRCVLLGQNPSTVGTFQKKFWQNSGKTPEKLSERFFLGLLQFNAFEASRAFPRFTSPRTLPFFRSGSREGLSEPVMEFPAVLSVFLNFQHSQISMILGQAKK